MKQYTALVILILSSACNTERMITHVYDYQPTAVEPSPAPAKEDARGGIFVEMGSPRGDTTVEQATKVFFARAGITFPRGSTFCLDTNTHRLTMRNTVANHESFQKIGYGAFTLTDQQEIKTVEPAGGAYFLPGAVKKSAHP